MRGIGFSLLALLSVSAFGQSFETPAQVKALDWMDGTWEGSIAMSIQGMDFEQKGTMTVVTDGNYKKITSNSETMGMTMVETSFCGWDAATSKYVMYTFANWVPTPRIERGSLEGTKLTMVSDPWDVPGMGPVVTRATMTKVSETEISFVMQFKEGDAWTPAGKGTYKKKATRS